MQRPKLDKICTYGESLGYAMKIRTKKEAKSYFNALVRYHLKFGKPDIKTRSQAVKLVRSNLGYWCGYYDHKTAQRVFKLFECAHPIFGRTT